KLNIPLAHELLATANEINNDIVFVAHGASTLYPQVVEYAVEQLDKMSGRDEDKQKWNDFVGTDWDQIEGLIEAGFCKINTDTENRQTFLSALLGAINENSAKIDIRWYDNQGTDALIKSYIQKLIMAGNYGVWHEPKMNVEKFKFDLGISLSDLISQSV
ncbi:MAG: class II fructose-bisphosphate aldolase, partial [Candidatus Neomarinimicrobiota bacterium]|nr:class II fructose-bisphosphate aldolase [Candidatus Neomarinimicrobiota bacterium]